MSISIPEELYHEILVRLPVKSLLVCKSVCKNWYALISTSVFVKTHINIKKNNPILMLKGTLRSDSHPDTLLYFIGYDSLASSSIVLDDVIHAIEMDYPFKSLGYEIVDLLGSSNGLICLRLVDSDGHRNLLCLWNPATREYKEMPESPIDLYDCDIRLHAFGYDQKNDDYKLFIGVEAPERENSTLILVYSLASNTWKTGKIVPYRFVYDQESGVLVNGDLHWVPVAQENYLLLSLDISDETFKEMQLPEQLMDKCLNIYRFLGVLEGCLCMLVSSDVDGQFQVWEMLDYGVRESWIKRYVIAHESITKMEFFLRLVYSFKDGVILFLNGRGLVLYDLKDGSSRVLKIDYDPLLMYFLDTKSYFESLVSLDSGTYVGGEADSKINRNPKKKLLMENREHAIL